MGGKLFIVKGADWSLDIEVEADSFDTCEGMAFEAMARAVDIICNATLDDDRENYGFGPFMVAYTEDGKWSHTVLTSDVLHNTGHHMVADMMKEKMDEDRKTGLIDQAGLGGRIGAVLGTYVRPVHT